MPLLNRYCSWFFRCMHTPRIKLLSCVAEGEMDLGVQRIDAPGMDAHQQLAAARSGAQDRGETQRLSVTS